MRIITHRELKPKKGIDYSRVHLARLEKAGKFPKKVKYGPGRVGYIEEEIDAHLAACAAAREKMTEAA